MKVIYQVYHPKDRNLRRNQGEREESFPRTFVCCIIIYFFISVTVFVCVSRLQKIVKDLNRQLQSQGSGPWPANRVGSVERSLGELGRILESKVL